MKQALLISLAVAFLMGCGAGHSDLTSITVSPQSATATSSPQGQVGYSAMGNFQNGKSRELSQVDGLSWKTSPTATGSVAATIGSTGEVPVLPQALSPSLPALLKICSSRLITACRTRSATVSGTATLICE